MSGPTRGDMKEEPLCPLDSASFQGGLYIFIKGTL